MFGKRKKRNKNYSNRYSKKNPSGYCICPLCNFSTPHNRGIPCFTLICPMCNVVLVKQKLFVNNNKQNELAGNIIMSDYLKVDTELCSGCGACVNECLSSAIIIEESKAKIINEKCINCRTCVDACPTEAIN